MAWKRARAGELVASLTQAADGLLFPSESDSPLTPVRWRGPPPSPEALLATEKRAPDTRVEELHVDELFAPLLHDAERPEESRRFQALVDLLGRSLADLRVYRVGEVDIDVFILGRAPSGDWLGLRTHVVET